MKKFLPLIVFILAFCGFLSTQILWDNFSLNADNIAKDKEKFSFYENNFKSLVLKTTDGITLNTSEIKKPIVILNFWASWCLPCLKEFPSLVKLQEKFKDQISVIGINGDEDQSLKKIDETTKKYSLNFPSVQDESSEISNKFLVNSYPVSIIFKKGKVIFVSHKIHDFMDKDFLKILDL